MYNIIIAFLSIQSVKSLCRAFRAYSECLSIYFIFLFLISPLFPHILPILLFPSVSLCVIWNFSTYFLSLRLCRLCSCFWFSSLFFFSFSRLLLFSARVVVCRNEHLRFVMHFPSFLLALYHAIQLRNCNNFKIYRTILKWTSQFPWAFIHNSSLEQIDMKPRIIIAFRVN